MNLTLDQEEKLRFMLADIEPAMNTLTRWEQDFIRDQLKRYDEYGANITLSSKQWAVINRIYEKVTDAD